MRRKGARKKKKYHTTPPPPPKNPKQLGRKEKEEKALNEAELIRVSKGCLRCLNPQ